MKIFFLVSTHFPFSENLENLINLVDARLDVVEKMTMYKYLEGLSVRSTISEYNFIYNAYLIANTSDYIITNFFQAQLYANQIAQVKNLFLFLIQKSKAKN